MNDEQCGDGETVMSSVVMVNDEQCGDGESSVVNDGGAVW